MKKNIYAFTLVELIVVITIVGVLSTIGFVVYSDYLQWVRDGTRLHQISEIHGALDLVSARSRLPQPHNSLQILSGATVLSVQGTMTPDILNQIQFQEGWIDPKTRQPYTYTISPNQRESQLMAYLESPTHTTIPTVSTGIYANLFPYVFGSEIGIYLSSSEHIPFQDTYTWNIDISTLSESDFIKLVSNK